MELKDEGVFRVQGLGFKDYQGFRADVHVSNLLGHFRCTCLMVKVQLFGLLDDRPGMQVLFWDDGK